MISIIRSPIKFPAATSKIVSQSRKFQKPNMIYGKRLDFYQKLDHRKSFSWVTWAKNQESNSDLNGIRANSNENVEGLQVFEHDLFVERSSPSLASGGIEAALNSLSKYLIVITFGAIILGKHDAEALWVTIGGLANVILSMTLKRILNQERPGSNLRSDPGMPSSHAQSIFYLTVFLILLLVKQYGINGFTNTLSLLIFISGVYFTWLQVSHQLHTASQVIVGAFIGSFFSIFWLWSWNTFVLNFFVSSLWFRILVVVSAIWSYLHLLYYVYRSWMDSWRYVIFFHYE